MSLTSTCMQVMQADAVDVVKEAVSDAMESSELPPEELFTDVYCE